MSLGQDPLFPTRTHPLSAGAAAGAAAPISADATTAGLLARVVGIDPDAGRPMMDSELAALGDPFFALVLGRGRFPRTAAELLAVLNEFERRS